MEIKNVNGRGRALALAFGLLGVAGAAAVDDAPPPVVVTAEDLRQWTLPAMTKLDATAAGACGNAAVPSAGHGGEGNPRRGGDADLGGRRPHVQAAPRADAPLSVRQAGMGRSSKMEGRR